MSAVLGKQHHKSFLLSEIGTSELELKTAIHPVETLHTLTGLVLLSGLVVAFFVCLGEIIF